MIIIYLPTLSDDDGTDTEMQCIEIKLGYYITMYTMLLFHFVGLEQGVCFPSLVYPHSVWGQVIILYIGLMQCFHFLYAYDI